MVASVTDNVIAVGGLVVSVLDVYNGDKSPYHDFFRRGSKAVGPMS